MRIYGYTRPNVGWVDLYRKKLARPRRLPSTEAQAFWLARVSHFVWIITLTKTIFGFGPQETTVIELLFLLTDGTHPRYSQACCVIYFAQDVIVDLWLLRPGFDSRPACMFDKKGTTLRFSSVTRGIIPSTLLTRILFTYHRRCITWFQ